jgi:hypothetical protein
VVRFSSTLKSREKKRIPGRTDVDKCIQGLLSKQPENGGVLTKMGKSMGQ